MQKKEKKKRKEKKEKKKKKVAFTFSVLAIIAFSTCIFFVSLDSMEKASGIREYKATISEDANFVEVNDRYEVVSQEGKLYILRDKGLNESDEQKGE